MAKRVEGVTERLLECAKEEFLKNGYENASLRVIAEKAGSSKGAIYIRYPDKESLYRALTQPVADGFCGLLKELLGGFESMSPENQREQINTYGNNGFYRLIDYIYDNFEEFQILLTSGESEIAQEFIHNIVEIDTACTMQYIEKTGNDAISSGRLTPDVAHLLSSAFYTGVFEVVIHGMAKKDAQRYIQSMSHFYNAGWNTIFNGIKGE